MLQPVEGLSDTERFLKVPLRGTFKNLSGFHDSAKRCNSADQYFMVCNVAGLLAFKTKKAVPNWGQLFLLDETTS